MLYCSVPSALQYVYRYESLLSSSSNPIQILPGKSLEDHTRRMTRSTIPQNVTNISVHTKSVEGCRDLYKSLSLVTIVIVSRHGKINLIRRSVQFQSGSILPGHETRSGGGGTGGRGGSGGGGFGRSFFGFGTLLAHGGDCTCCSQSVSVLSSLLEWVSESLDLSVQGS